MGGAGIKPRLIALLAWYDESPTWLAGLVASLPRAGVTHLVAADGAYALFPGASRKPRSPIQQQQAIATAAYGAGLGLTMHVPEAPYAGGEVEKRSLLFRLGEQVATPWQDWYFALDADEIVSYGSESLLPTLARTDCHVGEPELWWADDTHATGLLARQARLLPHDPAAGRARVRTVLRAIPGLRVEGAHYVYVADVEGEPVVLRGRGDLHDLAAAVDLTSDLRVEHRHAERSRERMERAAGYYRLRDTLGVERLDDMVPA